MNSSIAYPVIRYIRHILLHAGAMAIFYIVPALSHLLNIPIYLFEPMRIMLFVILAFSSRNNAYLVAVSLPLFSFFISSHPSVIKTVLISLELSINVFLYYYLIKTLKNAFSAAFLSIILSKSAYYFLKFAFISLAFIEGGLISTPLYIQLIITVVLSISIYGLSHVKK